MKHLLMTVLFLPLVALATGESIARYQADKDYIALREKALKTTASELHVDAKQEEAFGLVADIGMDAAAITIVVFKNGDIHMYNSKGGYRLGGKVSTEIRKAGEKALLKASAEISRMKSTSDFDVVLPGHARVYVLTRRGIFFDEADMTHMNPDRPAYTLITAIDPVITGFRHLEPGYNDSH